MASNLTPEQRQLRARLAIHTRYSRPAPEPPAADEDIPVEFLDEVDPDRVLDPVVRARRAGHAWKAHQCRLEFEASRGQSAAS